MSEENVDGVIVAKVIYLLSFRGFINAYQATKLTKPM